MYTLIKKYNDFAIITQVKRQIEQDVVINRGSKGVNEEKLINNIVRAKQKVYDYAIMNNFKYFFTGTINGNYDRSNYKKVYKKVSQKFRDIRKVCGELEYLIIVEYHKDKKNYHFHGLLKGNIEQYTYINNNGYLSLSIYDKFGFNSISDIKDLERCSAYITKYINKSFSERKVGERLYFVSRGLKLPEEIRFNDFLELKKCDYENDYCKKLKISIDKFNQLCNY